MAIEKTVVINAETEKAQKNVKDLSKELDNNQKEFKQSTDATKEMGGVVDSATGGMISKFTALTGTLKIVTGGFRTLAGAIASTGLGLLVIAIASVTAAFRSSEGGQNKFAKLMGVIGTVVGNATDILADFGDVLINVTTGNFAAAKKSFDSATNSIKNFGKETRKEIGLSQEISDKRAKADKIERDLIVQKAEAERKRAELLEKAQQRDKFTQSQRISFLQQASKIDEEITKKQIFAAKLRSDAIIQENKLSKTTKEAATEEANAKAQLINLEADRLRRQKEVTSQIQGLREQEKALAKSEVQEAEKTAVEKAVVEDKSQEEILKIRQEYARKIEDLNAETQIQKIELEEKRATEELDRLNANETEKLELIKYYERLKNEELENIRAEEFEKNLEKATEMADNEELSFQDRLMVLQEREFFIQDMFKGSEEEKLKLIEENQSKIDSIKDASAKEDENREEALSDFKQNLATSTLSLLGGLAKQGSKLGKAVAVSQATISTFQGVNKALAETTDFTPTQSLRFLNAAIVGASGLANIGKIISTPEVSVGGGGASAGGGQSVPQAPSFNLVEGTGTNQIAESLNQEQSPIKAYVVSSEVTTSQSLDRSIETTATI